MVAPLYNVHTLKSKSSVHEVRVHNRLAHIGPEIHTGSRQLIPRKTNKKDDIEYDK